MDARIVEFAEVLRQNGVRVSTSEVVDASQATALVGVSDRDLFRSVLRATMVKRDLDLESFDRILVYRGIEELRAYRGEPVEEMLDQHRQFVDTDQGVTNKSNYAAALAAFQFASGRYREAIDNWVRSAELNSTNSGTDLPNSGTITAVSELEYAAGSAHRISRPHARTARRVASACRS